MICIIYSHYFIEWRHLVCWHLNSTCNSQINCIFCMLLGGSKNLTILQGIFWYQLSSSQDGFDCYC